MVKIRLSRGGSKKRPMYRIVAVDSRASRETRVLEFLGTYEPMKDGRISLRESAIEAWLAKGARPSDTVASLLRRHRDGEGEASEAAPPAPPADEAAEAAPSA